jgi:hypothetical protein
MPAAVHLAAAAAAAPAKATHGAPIAPNVPFAVANPLRGTNGSATDLFVPLANRLALRGTKCAVSVALDPPRGCREGDVVRSRAARGGSCAF